MARTKRKIKGIVYRDKLKPKRKDRKDFGYTYGEHSQFEKNKEYYRIELENTPIDNPWYEYRKRRYEERYLNKTYPIKGIDFDKHEYGNGSKKRIKHYKKEIE